MLGTITENRYYVFRSGNWVGPYEIRDLRRCWALGTLVGADYIYIEPENETVQAGNLFQKGIVATNAVPHTGFNQTAGGYQMHSKRLQRKIRNAFFGLAGGLGLIGAVFLYLQPAWLLCGYGFILVSLLLAAWGAFRIARLPGIALIIALLAGTAVLTRMQLKAPRHIPQAELQGKKSSQVFLGPPATEKNL